MTNKLFYKELIKVVTIQMSIIPFLKKVENKKYTFFDPLLQKKVNNTFAIRQ